MTSTVNDGWAGFSFWIREEGRPEVEHLMPFPHAIAAVIFDMDGLLFDTERLYAEAMTEAAREMGTRLTHETMCCMIGLPVADCDAVLIQHLGVDFETDEFWSLSFKNFRELAETRLSLKAGVIELLDRLDRQKLPRAIATSSGRESVNHHLDKVGILDRFDAIVAYGDYTHGKPHPAPYLAAAEKLGVEARSCLALEDSPNGVRSAFAAGMTTVMVPDLIVATDEMQELAVKVVRDLHEVCVLLDRHWGEF